MELDFDAPLLSVRRPPRRSSPPLYRPELNSGPVSNPGVIPFIWEDTPGQPKYVSRPTCHHPIALNLPPSRIPNKEPEKEEEVIDQDEAFFDTIDTMSRTESLMNCSISSLSGIDDGKERRFTPDPQIGDFMMSRFLPASAAVSSLQCVTRKQGERRRSVKSEGSGDYRQPLHLSDPYGANLAPHHANGQEEDEDGDEYDDNLPEMACGLLPLFFSKTSLCILNPSGRRIRSLVQVGDEADNSWEAVYEHKLGDGDEHRGEDVSRITSESNRLTYWSDESSSHHNSIGGKSPYRNEAPPSPFREGKSFLGVPKGERKNSWSNGSDSGSSSVSSSIEIKGMLKPTDKEDEVKSDDGFLPNLLPPLLPKSPSKSWLSRTLPSISSKNHPKQTFLGIQFKARKQALEAASIDQAQESEGKSIKMLMKPLSLESEV